MGVLADRDLRPCVLLSFAGARLSDLKTLPIREVYEGEFRQLKPPDLLACGQGRGFEEA